MKVKYLLLSLVGAVALNVSAQAQTAEPASLSLPGYKVAFARSTGNWFITVQGGRDANFAGENQNKSLFDRTSWIPQIGIGKWHNPYFASRIKFEGFHNNSFTGNKGQTAHSFFFLGAHYDFMLDVMNYFMPYDADRKFHLLPFAGLGGEYKQKVSNKDRVLAVTATAGVQAMYNVTKRIDVVAELQATYNNFNLVQAPVSPVFNGLRGTLTAGINYRLGEVGFNIVDPYDYALIDGLNQRISSLRADNDKLSLRPEFCPECPDVVDQVSSVEFLNSKAVIFRKSSDKVDANQLIHIFDASEVAKNSLSKGIVVTGYAQKGETGAKTLAERRAKAVARILTETYNVPSEKITVEWKEVGTKVFSTNNWNSVVVLSSK